MDAGRFRAVWRVVASGGCSLALVVGGAAGLPGATPAAQAQTRPAALTSTVQAAPAAVRCAQAGSTGLGAPTDSSPRTSPPRSDGAVAHATVTGLRTGRHACFDRVVIDFAGGVPEYRVRWLARGERLRADGSGRVVPLQGERVLEVVLLGADRFEAARRTAPRLPAVRSTYLSPSFEATVQVGVGVRTGAASRVSGLRVFEIGGAHPRLVIDVAHPR
ncbi:AMIN-like domain-containing (lipo)protein [Quadrisphaera sp. KR29]|uniref:AMIN-like domain-containing (lipo)protein n=1 Tax=Quadrisphaera sp. KR29 TaxID=3461391 RepID=UPI004043A12A